MEPIPNRYDVTSVDEISEILGEPPDFVRAKVSDEIDASAATFISHSPLVFAATVDGEGRIDVSPKGDAPGFVEVVSPRSLLIPERKGNNLAFGPRNIVATGRVGLIFVVPGTRETLRVNGSARLNNDPASLDRLGARGQPALLCTDVTVEECFFHCGKAMIRSKAWDPNAWTADASSFMVAQVVDGLGGDPALAPIVAARVEQNYVDDL